MSSREYTSEEIAEQLVDAVIARVQYWDKLEGKTQKERLEGLAFSIFSILDGRTFLPSFIVATQPHPTDKPYNIEKGENYYPENHEVEIKGVYSDYYGSLFHRRLPKE